MTNTRNSLSENVRGKSGALLNRHLAAAIDLHAQVKQAHWNVRGSSFIGLHELFDANSTDVEDWSDLLAERAGALGLTAEGTIQQSAERSHLTLYPLSIADSQAHRYDPRNPTTSAKKRGPASSHGKCPLFA